MSPEGPLLAVLVKRLRHPLPAERAKAVRSIAGLGVEAGPALYELVEMLRDGAREVVAATQESLYALEPILDVESLLAASLHRERSAQIALTLELLETRKGL